MAKILLVIFFIAQLFTLASAAELSLPLRGRGDYKWLFLNVYEASLWGEVTEDLFSRPLRLELQYKRNFNGVEIVDQSIKELQRSSFAEDEIKIWRPKLLEIIPDVKEGDKVEARFSPDSGIVFFLNSNKELGKITDINFSKKFLNIWLGEKTSAPELRKKLLGIKI